MAVNVVLIKYPTEARIIGGLVTSYGDLEISLMHCVSVVRDLDTVLKAMFRDRGENRRINVADALGRQRYSDLSLGNEFSMAIAAIRYCMKIRNQFAHAVLHDDLSGKLAFVNLEELAHSNKRIFNLHDLTMHHVDVPQLRALQGYFSYTASLIRWVQYQARHALGEFTDNPVSKPPQPRELPAPFLP